MRPRRFFAAVAVCLSLEEATSVCMHERALEKEEKELLLGLAKGSRHIYQVAHKTHHHPFPSLPTRHAHTSSLLRRLPTLLLPTTRPLDN